MLSKGRREAAKRRGRRRSLKSLPLDENTTDDQAFILPTRGEMPSDFWLMGYGFREAGRRCAAATR